VSSWGVQVTEDLAAHEAEEVREYLAFCETAGLEPAWCLHCGTYLPLANGTRPTCHCTDPGQRRRTRPVVVIRHIGAVVAAGPWGAER
jgi:hypothetical protein